ncbi:MAG: sigma-70 family RNA polymerase sigma factor [Phenylobacterium sp.]|uniref:sigma-70 family RNA polymerase sigma factor n=1 Tax=Phenylobacterium sp. TaxID=1871053 RepID=UPI00273609D0|nr:sigma-70 family RNA polymerase sigma factor [Phenylobacterium sp.]MDP3746260.1 sigma-70 family RNA polymerase sigma factor [Phenylobacterium sp.]
MGPLDPPPILDHLDALRSYARTLTLGGQEADDLVHDALVRAYDKRHTFRADGDLGRWLLSILHNTFVSNLRRERAEAARIEKAWRPGADRVEPAQEHAAEVARVQAAFVDLPAEQRAVLHLVVGEGLSYQDVAQVLNLPLGTVMSRLARARSALRPADLRGEAASSETPRRKLRIVGGTDDD